MNSLFSRSQLETSFSLVFIAILCSFEVLKIQIFCFLKRLLYRVKTQIEAFGQTVLPDSSILIGQKLVETAKTQKLRNETILSHIQTLCVRKKAHLLNFLFRLVVKITFLWEDLEALWCLIIHHPNSSIFFFFVSPWKMWLIIPAMILSVGRFLCY